MNNEKERREEIFNLVKEYYNDFHKKNENFEEGDRISYAARVYDEEEMLNLIDSS
jgi:CDP-6-deoxy-D-xylo-4-hexulose-3-dehydrase